MTPIYGASQQQIDYRLGLQHGCTGGGVNEAQVGYRMDVRERPLRWIGGGLAEFGITAGAELTPEQFDMARALLQGQDPRTGEQLVRGKLAVPDDAKLPLAPLVAAVREHAQQRGIMARELFVDERLARQWTTAERQVQRLGEAARLRADEALELVDAALPAPEGSDPLAVLPWSRDEAVTAYANLTEAHVKRDEKTGELSVARRPRRVDVGIKGFDINIGLPKSYSLLLGFAPEDVAARVEDIYAATADKVFGWVEERTSYVMRGQHGRGRTADRLDSSGFAGWVMVHRAARPVGDAPIGDPHWHVHITVANMARGIDEKWSGVAAGGRDLMRHAAVIDKLTQAQVRRELSSQLGIQFARNERTGLWEVAHIPDATIQLFSKRGGQVQTLLEELGYDRQAASAAQQRVLTRASRTTKTETVAAPDETLRAYWRREAVTAGGQHHPDTWMPRVLAEHLRATADPVVAAQVDASLAAAPTQPIVTVAAIAQALADPETGLTAHSRRFSRLDALCAVADELPAGATPEDVERMTDLVLEHPAFVPLAGHETQLSGGAGQRRQLGARHMTNAALFTTKDVPEVESRILAAAAASTTEQQFAVVEQDTLDLAVSVVEAEQGFSLSGEQRQVLADVVRHGHQLRTVEGPPGTGKTTLMRAARVAWSAQGYTVAGAATAAVAAQNLAAESGIDSLTVAQWLHRIDTGQGLAGVDVLVLDEANLTSDRDRARLYAEAERTGTKLVEVGDPQQLRGVGVGSLFGYVHRTLDGPRLSENRRQADEDERAALAAWRAGHHHEALQNWADRGRVHATETAQEALAGMVATWLQARQGAPDPHTQAAGLVMLAATNAQVDRINQATQAVRLAEGELGEGRRYRTPGGGELAVHVGDQVLIRRNDRRGLAVTGERVLNGYRGVVTGISDQGVDVEWHDDEQLHHARLQPRFIAQGGLELGYALTAHKAEGLTVGGSWERPDGTEHRGSVLVYAPGMDNPGLYVSASRHKDQVVLFGSREELEGDREQLLHGTPRSHDELTARVIARLAERAEATAESANDRPVLADLGHEAAEPHQPAVRHEAAATAAFAFEPGHADSEPRERAVEAERSTWERIQELRSEVGDTAVPRELSDRAHDWRSRPHGHLGNRELDRAIEAERARHEKALARQQRRRDSLAELEPQVEAGHGPRVRAVDERLAEQREQARPAQAVAEAQRQWRDKDQEAKQHYWDANRIQRAADRLPWYRIGTRRAEAERAEQARQRYAQAQRDADVLKDRYTAVEAEFGGWRRTLADLERAERAHPRDREQAQQADERNLDQLRRGITSDGATARQASQRLAELEDEKATRAAMPPAQAGHEQAARIRWLFQQAAQQRQEVERQEAEEAERQRHEHELDHIDRMHRDLHRGMDGPSLGL